MNTARTDTCREFPGLHVSGFLSVHCVLWECVKMADTVCVSFQNNITHYHSFNTALKSCPDQQNRTMCFVHRHFHWMCVRKGSLSVQYEQEEQLQRAKTVSVFTWAPDCCFKTALSCEAILHTVILCVLTGPSVTVHSFQFRIETLFQ